MVKVLVLNPTLVIGSFNQTLITTFLQPIPLSRREGDYHQFEERNLIKAYLLD